MIFACCMPEEEERCKYLLNSIYNKKIFVNVGIEWLTLSG